MTQKFENKEGQNVPMNITFPVRVNGEWETCRV